jgi:RNA polymerase sigma factor (sigma-70 family)
MANGIRNSVTEIWERFLNGDKETFSEIYNLFIDDLFRYGTKLSQDEELVKDAIQEVFIDLYINGRNKKEPALKYYLILALKRNLIRKLQKNRKSESRAIVESDLFDTQYSFEEQLIREEAHIEVFKKVQNAMDKLPPKQKEAIYLRYNQSLEYDQIARILGISVESVRKQVYRGLKAVRNCMDNMGLVLLSILKTQMKLSSEK